MSFNLSPQVIAGGSASSSEGRGGVPAGVSSRASISLGRTGSGLDELLSLGGPAHGDPGRRRSGHGSW